MGIESSFANPLLAPPYGPPPYPVEDAELVVARFRAAPEAVAAAVPAPLEPLGDGVVTAFVGRMWQSRGPGEFFEGGLSVGVVHDGHRSSYTPILLTSTEDALYVGREVFGLPKLLCDPGEVEVVGNGRRATLRRRGAAMLSLAVRLDEPAEGTAMLPHDRYMLKRVPSPDPDVASTTQLVHQRLDGHWVAQAFRGRARVEVGADLHVDLEAFAPQEVLEAWYVRAGWDVPGARIVAEWR